VSLRAGSSNNDLSLEEIRRYLSGWVVEGGERFREEYEHYLQIHAHRFYETWKAIPTAHQGDRLLELGASPYCMTLLLEHYSGYTVTLSDLYRTGDPEESAKKLVNTDSGEERTLTYQTFNVEFDRFPYPDNSFEMVLCCELVEHLTADPTHMLKEIHRVLTPGGRMLITTPNILVLRNLVALLKDRRNIYYPYSGYGPYGRHNREWTLEELAQLVTGCGYTIESAQIVDTYAHYGKARWLKKVFPFVRDYLVVLGRAEGEPRDYYPENLYEALPRKFTEENPIPSRRQEGSGQLI